MRAFGTTVGQAEGKGSLQLSHQNPSLGACRTGAIAMCSSSSSAAKVLVPGGMASSKPRLAWLLGMEVSTVVALPCTAKCIAHSAVPW